ncbi:pentatricopeptide repeat-containing protein At5g02830, chloroplastic isoform X2 [Ananas comosus]|uniref:Pentatricopeptide repeat-containing protein At5g02830, chloroplastic isoform X2 n=1 Tax=Ananas comosus TaxID=4615 RepID=A0A6P5ETL9_ANACO|nr:pentatricopeptide repeat-containing protein At5g02830, chloroplastic isoform X2 [Ananas comosus]
MAESSLVLPLSLLLPPQNPKSPPRSPPLRRRNLRPLTPKPLLSDVRRDLTSPSSPSTSAASAAAAASTRRRILTYYARLASKLARSGRLRDFLMVAESILTSDAAADDDSPQFVARLGVRMVSEGVSSLLWRGRLQEVLDFVREAERIGISSPLLFDATAMDDLATECRRLLDQDRLEEFVVLMETLAGYRFFVKDIIDPVDILKKLVKKRDLDLAVRYARVFPHSQLLLCFIIQEFGNKRDLTSAIRAFEVLKQQSGGINMFACRSIIDICGHCGDFLRSRIILEELLAEKIVPNVYVFNSLMNVNAHDLSYTLQAYKNMQNLGVAADLTSYNILLKACCNARRVDLAQNIYRDMKHLALNGALKLNVYTYSTMIKVFADAKMWQMALSIKDDMLISDVSPNMITWSSLISACAKSGLVDKAIQVFEEMLINGCEPNAQCCNIILCACVESCQYDKAFRLFYSWKDTGFKIFCTSKAKRSPLYSGSEPTYTVVPFKPTIATFNILMKACGLSQCISIAAAFRRMQDIGITPDVVAYTTAIKACVENKKLKMAFSLFEEMKKFQLQPNWVTYNTLLRARSRYGSLYEVQQCLAVYQDMRKAGYSSNDYYLKELIEEWCEGVLCSKNQNQELVSDGSSVMKGESRKLYDLFLEKVAAHLQKDIGENQIIDIRGLTKVEARIIVLSVLRMIKESYLLGNTIQEEDMIIITGVGKEAKGAASHPLEVQQTLVGVLKNELGLDVMTGHRALCSGRAPPHSDSALRSPTVLEMTEVVEDYTHLARRPRDLGVLKVTRDSLQQWLQKKSSQGI